MLLHMVLGTTNIEWRDTRGRAMIERRTVAMGRGFQQKQHQQTFSMRSNGRLRKDRRFAVQVGYDGLEETDGGWNVGHIQDRQRIEFDLFRSAEAELPLQALLQAASRHDQIEKIASSAPVSHNRPGVTHDKHLVTCYTSAAAALSHFEPAIKDEMKDQVLIAEPFGRRLTLGIAIPLQDLNARQTEQLLDTAKPDKPPGIRDFKRTTAVSDVGDMASCDVDITVSCTRSVH